MIFEWIFLVFMLFLTLIFQLTLAPIIEIFGVEPDIVFAAVVAVGSCGGFFRGSVSGAGVGVIMDIMFLNPGLYSLQYTLTGLCSGLFRAERTRFFLPVLFCMPVYAFKELVFLVVLYLRKVSVSWEGALFNIFIGTIYTAVFVLLITMLLNRMRKNFGFFDDSDLL